MGIDNLKHDNKRKVIISVLKILLLIAIVAGIPLYIYFFRVTGSSSLKGFDDVVAYLQRYKWESVPIYIGLQVLQIVISVIPGQVFPVCCRIPVFFFPCAAVFHLRSFHRHYSVFLSCKNAGKRFCTPFSSAEKKRPTVCAEAQFQAGPIDRIYLVSDTGPAKDVVSYAAGVSEMKFKPFILLSLTGRLPGMMGSIMIGSMWNKGEYFGMIALGVIAVAAFVLCIVFRKKNQPVP